VEFKIQDDQARVVLTGRIDDHKAEDLWVGFKALNKNRFRNMVMDMAGVTSLSSAAISKMVVISRELQNRDGCLYLVNLPEDLRTMLSVIKLDRIFKF